MILDAPSLDLSDVESKIAGLLAAPLDAVANVQRACEHFGFVLENVLRLLPGNQPARYWDLDDISCDSANRTGDVVTLQGTCDWLSGSEDCDRFRIDIALGQEPLLFAYKFTNSATGKQLLYVGKTPEGWLINGP